MKKRLALYYLTITYLLLWSAVSCSQKTAEDTTIQATPSVTAITPTPTLAPAITDSIHQAMIRVQPTSVIYLAGRDDIKIPPTGLEAPQFPLSCRGDSIEVFPAAFQIKNGTTFTFKVSGKVNFYGGPASEGFEADGDPNSASSSIETLGGISAFTGPQGSLVGIFLDATNPGAKTAPLNMDYSTENATNSASFMPNLGQIFFIGDGIAADTTKTVQTFAAPAGATRLFLGFADAAGFSGAPGCYGDNFGFLDAMVTGSDTLKVLPISK